MDLGYGAFNNIVYVPLDRGKFEEFIKYPEQDETFEYCKTLFIFDKIVFIASAAHKYCRYKTCVHRTLVATTPICIIFNAIMHIFNAYERK